jgi:hypothetical protein
MKKIIGTVITLVIGGTVYTFSQADVVKNFSKDTGLTQQEAEQYVSEIKDEDLAPFGEIGSDFISEGQDIVEAANEIDCVNYEYEWESYTLNCEEGKSQLKRFGNSEATLGRAYRALESEEAGEDEISSVIRNIDKLNSDLSLVVVTWILDPPTIDKIKKTNSYNKALLQAALDSD